MDFPHVNGIKLMLKGQVSCIMRSNLSQAWPFYGHVTQSTISSDHMTFQNCTYTYMAGETSSPASISTLTPPFYSSITTQQLSGGWGAQILWLGPWGELVITQSWNSKIEMWIPNVVQIVQFWYVNSWKFKLFKGYVKILPTMDSSWLFLHWIQPPEVLLLFVVLL